MKRILEWLAKRSEDYDLQEKARLCAPCDDHCGSELCRKVGCLNMDMRTNAVRLQLLVKRLESHGYVFPKRIEVIHSPSEADEIPINIKTNIVKISDYKKDESVD